MKVSRSCTTIAVTKVALISVRMMSAVIGTGMMSVASRGPGVANVGPIIVWKRSVACRRAGTNDERRQQDRHDDRDYWRRQQDRRDDERRQQDWHDDERRRQDQQHEEEQNDQQLLEILRGTRSKALSRPQSLSRPRRRLQEWEWKYGDSRFAPPLRR